MIEKIGNQRVATGSRIRALRLDRELRQGALAAICDISPSYLNLIEHDKRPIGGALLLRIAEALGVEPSALSDEADVSVALALSAAAASHPDAGAEKPRVQEFTSRFPGWARVIERLLRDVQRLQQTAARRDARLGHNAYLSASMHNVLSSVTSIRSASAILARSDDVAPEWEARFHRNILEDSERLASDVSGLMSYLDAADEDFTDEHDPIDEFESWMSVRGWYVGEIEADPGVNPERIVIAAPELTNARSREFAQSQLRRYAEDVRLLPLRTLIRATQDGEFDAISLAESFDVPLSVVLRRLATLPPESLFDGQTFGLLACDGDGRMLFRKRPGGMNLIRPEVLWPLFQAINAPMVPHARTVSCDGSDFHLCSYGAVMHPDGLNAPPKREAWMLIKPIHTTVL